MKHLLFSLLWISVVLSGFSQDLSKITNLNDEVSETSGLIFLDDRLITHNDSGGMNALYEVSVTDGSITRTVTIQNASNVDWEDICRDDNFIYIGDFGNNNGNRTNLRIYKISQADYLNNIDVNAEVINFSYQDQTDFSAAPNATNYDAETIISFGNDLFIFTKNWVDLKTNVYKVSKVPGTYEISKVDEIDVQGLITGGTYNPLANKVILTGYSGLKSFAVELSGFSGGKFSNGLVDKYDFNIPLTESFQIEGITYKDATNYYISSEKNSLGSASLYSLVSSTLGIDELELLQQQVYPNPGTETLTINGNFNLNKIEIFDYLGKKIVEDSPVTRDVDISELPKGVYIIKLYADKGNGSLKFIKQ